MSTKTISFKADEKLKKEFDQVAKNLSMPVSAMYTVFMRKVVDTQGIPFELKVGSREALNQRLGELLHERVEQAEFVDLNNKEEVAKLMDGWDEW